MNLKSIMDSTGTFWLGVIGVVLTLQMIGMAIGIVVLVRWTRQTQAVLDSMASEARPLLRQTAEFLDEMHHVTTKLRELEASAAVAAHRVNQTWTVATSAVRLKLWPVLGAARAAQAVIKALRRRSERLDRQAEQRFVYEGGSHASE